MTRNPEPPRLQGVTIAMLIADGSSRIELEEPRRALEAAGAAAAGAPGSTSAPGAIIDVLEEADAEEAG